MTEEVKDILTYEEHQRFIKSEIDRCYSEINQGELIKDELELYSTRQPDSCAFFSECVMDLFKYIEQRNTYLCSEVKRLKKMWDEEVEK